MVRTGGAAAGARSRALSPSSRAASIEPRASKTATARPGAATVSRASDAASCGVSSSFSSARSALASVAWMPSSS